MLLLDYLRCVIDPTVPSRSPHALRCVTLAPSWPSLTISVLTLVVASYYPNLRPAQLSFTLTSTHAHTPLAILQAEPCVEAIHIIYGNRTRNLIVRKCLTTLIAERLVRMKTDEMCLRGYLRYTN
jgi:hypothetical protein